MKNILYIGDYIEGQPRIASIRYDDIMKEISKEFNIVCINDSKNISNSIYSIKDFKFISGELDKNKLKQSMSNNNIKNIIKKSMLYKWYKIFTLSNNRFNKINYKLYEDIFKYLDNNTIDCIFISVPTIYPIYILKEIKKKYPNIKVVIEIRDIINSKLFKDYPQFILKNAEKDIIRYSDTIIALSEGIKKYYEKLKYKNKIITITNGFNYEKFIDFKKDNDIKKKNELTFTHLGSIYGGRNLKDFVLGLNDLSKSTNKNIVLNLIGNLDSIAELELKESLKLNTSSLQVNRIGLVPHDKALEFLRKSDYAVILTHRTGSDYAIPGKTFEYIGAYKPIIAVTEDKELIELINNKFGFCAMHERHDIFLQLTKLINKDFDYSNREEFSRNNKIKSIISVINEITKF